MIQSEIDIINFIKKNPDKKFITSGDFKKKFILFSKSDFIDEIFLTLRLIMNQGLFDLIALIRMKKLFKEEFETERKLLSSYLIFDKNFHKLVLDKKIDLSNDIKDLISKIIEFNKKFKESKNSIIPSLIDFGDICKFGFSKVFLGKKFKNFSEMSDIEITKELESFVVRHLFSIEKSILLPEDFSVDLTDQREKILIIDDSILSISDIEDQEKLEEKFLKFEIRIENIKNLIEAERFVNIANKIQYPLISDFLLKFDSNQIKIENSKEEIKDQNFSTLFESIDYKIENPILSKSISLSNSSIKNFLENPYFFYINKILGIRYFNIEDNSESPAIKGKIIHKICEEFSKVYKIKSGKVDFFEFAKSILDSNYSIDIEKNIYWNLYIKSIEGKIVLLEKESINFHVETEKIIHSEFLDFDLMAIIDRIEYIDKKTVNIYDFKTSSSSIYTFNDEKSGKNPQMSIIAFILKKMGFVVKKASYVCLEAKNNSKEDVVFNEDQLQSLAENFEKNVSEIIEFIKNANFEDFFYIENDSFGKFDDYFKMEHFARIRTLF